MKAVRFEGKGQLALREVDKPKPTADELLVRIEACGICGTDRHIVKGEFAARTGVTLGHEFCGTIEAVGPAVSGFSAGERITGDPNIACGLCAACRSGKVNLCTSLSALGIHRDGGFAPYAVVPQKQAFRLPPGVDAIHGAFCEPLACCIHGVDMAGLRPGASVVVLGGGVIGMLVVQLARLAGATRIILSTRQAEKRRLAGSLGATATIDPSQCDAVEAIAGQSGLLPGGADVVFECAGVAETVEQAPRLAGRGGTVVILGVLPPGIEIRMEALDLLLREVTLKGSFINPFTHARAVELIATGAVDVAPLVSRTIGIDEAVAVINAPAPRGEIRAIVVPQAD